MSDASIPFVQEYGEWAVEAAAMRTARGWRKGGYSKRTIEVPENKKYLAANSAKRNPSAPRGALFPARPSKQNRTTAPSDDNSSSDSDERIPTLPPGPSTAADPIRFHSQQHPGPPSNHTTHLTPGTLQPGFSSWFHPPTQPAMVVPNPQWGLMNPQFLPPPSVSTDANYWERPPPCAYANTMPSHPMHD